MQRNPTADAIKDIGNLPRRPVQNRIMAKRPSKRPAATACPWDEDG